VIVKTPAQTEHALELIRESLECVDRLRQALGIGPFELALRRLRQSIPERSSE
jgi:hypothetical protein